MHRRDIEQIYQDRTYAGSVLWKMHRYMKSNLDIINAAS